MNKLSFYSVNMAPESLMLHGFFQCSNELKSAMIIFEQCYVIQTKNVVGLMS